MKIDNKFHGTHNKVDFTYEKGFLHLHGRKWDREDIKNMVEIANLLELHGYKINSPSGSKVVKGYNMWGESVKQVEKTYDITFDDSEKLLPRPGTKDFEKDDEDIVDGK